MWLPRDERKLLGYYYRKINKVDSEQVFEIKELIRALGKEEQSGPKKTKREIILAAYNILENVNDLLTQRGLITSENLNPTTVNGLQTLPKTSEALSWPENTNVNVSIALTIKGYDLGRKYSSWWTGSGLWFAEYKNHWFWLIVSFLGGIIGALIVNWLSRGD